MKILVFGLAGNKRGGIETFLLNMHKNMSADCIFDYVIVGDSCIHTEEITRQGGEVFFLPSIKKNPAVYIRSLKQLLKSKRSTHEVIYCNLFSMVHVLPAVLARKLRYKVVMHAHNSNLDTSNGAYHLLHNMCRLLWGKMECLRLCNSYEAMEFMFGKGKNRAAELIYNAIDTEKFKFSQENRMQVRQELNLPEETVYGFSGRLAAGKNVQFLLDVFAEIRKKTGDGILLIAGDGEERDAIADKIVQLDLTESVVLLGLRTDMEKIYSAMDVYIFPSLHEGLGIVLIEAQATRLPCICSADVIPSIVCLDKELLSFVSLKEDAAVWAKEAIKKSEQRIERGSSNHLVADSPFNIRKEALRLEKMIEGYVE